MDFAAAQLLRRLEALPPQPLDRARALQEFSAQSASLQGLKGFAVPSSVLAKLLEDAVHQEQTL